MKKICFLITTRGNYGKTKTVISNLLGKADIQYLIGGTCPEINLYGTAKKLTIAPGAEVYRNASVLTIEAGDALSELKPDIVVIVGDRFECLPIAMQAYYMGIPIAHIEGGELSGNMDEGIRHAITKLASVHFVCEDEAADRVKRLGEHPDSIHNVGATSLDLMTDCPKGVGEYIVFILHPSEDINPEIAIDAVYSTKFNILWIDSNIDKDSDKINDAKIPLSYKTEDFANVLANALCIVGNSSSGIREASFLGIPCVNIGNRQNNRRKSYNVIDVKCNKQDIISAIIRQILHGRYEPDYIYGAGTSGKLIADILLNGTFSTQKVFYENNRDYTSSKWERWD